MNRRFFVENLISDDSLSIHGPDAHHIANVNRLSVGDDIVLFDGSGREFDAKITEIKKKSVVVFIQQVSEISREIGGSLILAVALPKGDRQKALVEKLVELGVSKLIPINSERSVVVANEKSVEKLNRRVIEASKQCGRNVLMQIENPMLFRDLVTSTKISGHKFVSHPYDASLNARAAADSIAANDCVAIVIGPEGGFAEPEIALAKQFGWKTLSLGRSILRVETAAAAAATLFGIGR